MPRAALRNARDVVIRTLSAVAPAVALAGFLGAAAGCGDGSATGPAAAPGVPSATNAATKPAPAGPAPAATPWFRDEAVARGIDFVHHSGATGEFWMPEMACPGCALFDMDGDGDLDALLIESDGVLKPRPERRGNRLYRNKGGGTFEDATKGSGVETHLFGMGAACGDYDDDGDTDLFLTGQDGFALLRNDGTGKFTDVSAEAGVAATDWGTSAAFFDYDGDGDLDLWVDCYLRWTPASERKCDAPRGGRDYCGPRAYNAPAPDHLYRNDGNGLFTDVSEAAGLRKAYGNGLGVATGDFDGDGRPDVFVANDGVENQLWLQKEPGRFEDSALVWGCAMDRDGTTKAGMGTCAIDFDDDGDLDLYVVNLIEEGDSVYRNEGRHFLDRTTSAGLVSASKPYTRFGVGVADFDLDGYLDIYVAHGGVTRTMTPLTADPYAETNQVMRGGPDLKFTEVKPAGGTAEPAVATSRGAAFGDVDDDGDVDVLVANRDGRPHLMINVAPRAGSWATLRVLEALLPDPTVGGPTRHRDALGATVTCRAGARRITRDVRAAYSYCASNDPRIHLGLGAATVLEDVRVRWTDGTVEAFGDVPAGRIHRIVRGEGRASEWPKR